MVELGDIIRVVLSHAVPNASECLNVFTYYVGVAQIDDSDLLAGLEAFFTNDWHPHWRELAAVDADMVGFEVDQVAVDGTVVRNIGAVALGLPGNATGTVLPAANAAYLMGYTAAPKQRGSKYVPGIAEGAVENGEFTAAALGDLALLLAAYLFPVEVAAVNALFPGVLSRTLQAFKGFNESGMIDTAPAYQRRRKQNVGA